MYLTEKWDRIHCEVFLHNMFSNIFLEYVCKMVDSCQMEFRILEKEMRTNNTISLSLVEMADGRLVVRMILSDSTPVIGYYNPENFEFEKCENFWSEMFCAHLQ